MCGAAAAVLRFLNGFRHWALPKSSALSTIEPVPSPAQPLLIFVGYHLMMMAADREGFQAVEQAHAMAQEYEQNWVDFSTTSFGCFFTFTAAGSRSVADKLASTLNEERATECDVYNRGDMLQLRGIRSQRIAQVCLDAAIDRRGILQHLARPSSEAHSSKPGNTRERVS
jgi:hypothetical protein